MTLAITGGVIAAAGTIGGAAISANAANAASQDQINADNAANAQQRKDQAPWTTAGGTAVTQLAQETQPGGQFNTNFTMADATNSSAETYAQQNALDASQSSAAAQGGLIGTGEQGQIETNAAGIASQYQGQAFNQWLAQNQQQINAQQSLAGEGMQSAANVADTGANLTVGAGNAAAAGTVGSANAVSGGLSSLTNQMTTLSSLFNNTGTNPQGIGSGYNTPGYTSTSGTLDTGATGIDTSANYNENTGLAINSAGDYSDERLKTDKRRVGYTDDGVPIFTYRMKGGGPTRMGVLAQDIEKSNPRAVTKDPQGLRMVDYRRVH
jgi:hypothetical protein